jgi:serine/threonine protein kinase
MQSTQNASKHPIFNNEYEIIKSLGEGNTSKVYLATKLNDSTGKQVAIKILKEEFLRRDEDSILSVQNEITILKNLNHAGIIRMIDFGDAGSVVKPSGRVISNLVFIVMEYVSGGLLFDLCQTMGAMGEDAGRFFMMQLVESIDYMHNLRCVHRDLKLENILVDEQLNLKVADFGFACYKSIDQLKSYRGTMTYMAPEIKEGKTYDGTQVDLFSIGVIIFIIVQGIFPFKEARKEEYFYNLLLTGQIETYFEKVNGTGLSAEFKDMILKLFSYDGSKRCTVEELKSHPWLNVAGFNKESARATLLSELNQRQMASKPAPF